MSTIFNVSELDSISREVLAVAIQSKKENRATIIALSGDLGAGKTTLVQFLAKQLGITEHLQSPTFVILKSYQLSATSYKLFTHIDAYRLNSKEELEKLNWQEYANNPDNLICIEWPEQVEGLLSEDILCVSLEHVSEQERKIKIGN
jgi:tRNA threonylcarbamoyladenosine biosynthesis protein TsaE